MSLKEKFQEEMNYLRRMRREFAHDNPKLARFLGDEASDPDVERMIEGFAFLTAKLRLKIEDDLPELTHGMLQLLWPNYLRPLPSATVVAFDPVERAVNRRKRVARGTRLLSRPVGGVTCEYRTCTDVDLYPLCLKDVSDAHSREKSIVRIDLEPTGGYALNEMDCDSLDFFLSGDDVTAQTLYLWLAQYLDEIRVDLFDGKLRRLPAQYVEFPGFAPEEALLPYPKNTFDGYRILQEYFLFPQRFHFFRLPRLRSVWPAGKCERIRFEFHFSRPMPPSIRVRRSDLALFCAPAVNLFEHDAEPITLKGQVVEQVVRPSGQHPDAYEIFSVDAVTGWEVTDDGRRGKRLRTYHPFESFQHEIEHAEGRTALYYRTRVEEAHSDDKLVHRIAFVRADESSHIGERETVSLALSCTNGNLPLSLEAGDICQYSETTPTVATVRNLTRPTPSYRPVLDGELQWALISNLSLNYLSLLSEEPLKAVLRAYDFASLHDLQHARATRKRLDSIKGATTRPIDRLMKGLPIRGLRTVLRLDLDGFVCEGDMYLFGSVLSHFFALYASINSFHELEVVNTSNNEQYEWPLQPGRQPLI